MVSLLENECISTRRSFTRRPVRVSHALDYVFSTVAEKTEFRQQNRQHKRDGGRVCRTGVVGFSTEPKRQLVDSPDAA